MSPKLKKSKSRSADKFDLYLASVQSPDADVEFFQRVYEAHTGKDLRVIREDFCGTAALCAEWVKMHPENRAIGLDLDQVTLAWGEKNILSLLGEERERVTILCANVLEEIGEKVALTSAQNFSYNIFKTREDMLEYFRAVYLGLEKDGLFVLDMMGGTDAVCEDCQDRKITDGKMPDGTPIPPFTYSWDQVGYNPIDGDFQCHIHFTIKRGKKFKKAFVYDWRLWTLPELRELLLEAGFRDLDVYTEGWDDDTDDTDGHFELCEDFDNEGTWIAYLVAKKS